MIDVDQYVDMKYLLNTEFNPVMLYTFQPTVCASNMEGEYSFTFDDDDAVDYRVAGGAQYKHHVWNYGLDHVIVKDGPFGIPLTTTAYLVDKRATSAHHELILLTPVKRWKGFWSLLAACLQGTCLERLILRHGDYLRLNIQTGSGVRTSTARVGSYSCATVNAKIDEAIAAVSRTTKLDLTLPQVTKQLLDGKEEVDTADALVLLEYHRALVPCKPDFVYPVEQSVKHYSFVERKDPGDFRPAVVPFMPPMMPECYAPVDGEINEKRAIDKRIREVKDMKVKATPFLMTTMAQFTEKLYGKPHQLVLATDDEVHERQNRPSQRRILEEAQTTSSCSTVQSFLKKETYDSPNDPRVITTINAHDKLEYSKVTYPIAAVYAAQPWYAFGKTPLQIANHVAAGAQNASFGCMGDFSRQDRQVNEISRDLNVQEIAYAFNVKESEKAIERAKTQHHVRGFGRHGTKYESTWQRLSGSPETAVFNSGITARIVFLSYRMTIDPATGTYYTPERAWEKLCACILGGDDSVVWDVDPKILVKASAMLGQILEVEKINRGCDGINFLSRFYTSRVWFGCPDSTCDLQRQLRKFHVTIHLPPNVSSVDKLVEKARALYLTDAKTPILGLLSSYVVELSDQKNVPELNNLNLFTLSTEYSEQYPNDINEHDATVELERSKIPVEAVARLATFLLTKPSLEELTTAMPLLVEPSEAQVKLKGDVLVGDELMEVIKKALEEASRDDEPLAKDGDKPSKDAPKQASEAVAPVNKDGAKSQNKGDGQSGKKPKGPKGPGRGAQKPGAQRRRARKEPAQPKAGQSAAK
jgi:hypothetical protein